MTAGYSVDSAIELLKNAVKFSHINNQKHIDLTIPMASERHRYQAALIFLRQAINKGEMSEEELKKRLGLV